MCWVVLRLRPQDQGARESLHVCSTLYEVSSSQSPVCHAQIACLTGQQMRKAQSISEQFHRWSVTQDLSLMIKLILQ